MADGVNFGIFIETAARELLGKPNQKLSSKTELRFGKNGSVSVDVATGRYFDHETKTGGGTLDLIVALRGGTRAEAADWLHDIGCDVPERAGANQHSSAPRRPRDNEPPPWDGPPEYDERASAGPSPARGDVATSMQDAMRRGPTAVYPYVDANGELLFEVCRYEFVELSTRQKTFRQRRKPVPGDDPQKIKGGYIWSLDGVEQVPYRLPQILDAIAEGRTIYVVEGEKDVHTLVDWGFDATCNAAGSGKWPDSLTLCLAGAKRVVLLEDNDKAGRNHTNVVGNALRGTVQDLRIMDFSDLPEKSDVTDFRDHHGGDADAFIDRLEKRMRPWTPSVPVSQFGAVRFIDMDNEAEETEWLVEGLLTARDKSIIGGESGSGKSFFSSNLGYHVALGWPYLGRPVRQGLVCYQAGESARGMRRRMRAFRNDMGVDKDADVPFVMLSKRIDLFTPIEKGNKDLEQFIAEVRAWENYYAASPLQLVVVDTLARASVGAEENSAKDMGLVIENLDRLEQALRCHVSAVHHMNAQGDRLRGSGVVRANVDQVLVVSLDADTRVRTVTVSKQKDDEDGGKIEFELKSVRLGETESGRPITSCVVVPAGWRDSANGFEPRQPGEKPKTGFRVQLRQSEGVLFRAVLDATREHGEYPPPDLARRFGLPDDRRVVRWEHVKSAFEAKTDLENEESIRKALQRGGASLVTRTIINRDAPFVWWTGVPVRDVPETYPRRQTASDGDNVVPLRPGKGGESTLTDDEIDMLGKL